MDNKDWVRNIFKQSQNAEQSWLNIIRMIKSKRLRWGGQVVLMGRKRNA
jgi:hypothetical protein